MSDLIEMAIAKIQEQEVMAVSEMDRVYNQALHTAIAVVKGMPSAQPVITCDGCRFVSTYDTEFPCCSCVRREKDYYAPER